MTKLKSLVFAVVTVFAATGAWAASETKEVCHDKKDKAGKIVKDKLGKTVQNCKKIKVHKKVEGKKVPEKK